MERRVANLERMLVFRERRGGPDRGSDVTNSKVTLISILLLVFASCRPGPERLPLDEALHRMVGSDGTTHPCIVEIEAISNRILLPFPIAPGEDFDKRLEGPGKPAFRLQLRNSALVKEALRALADKRFTSSEGRPSSLLRSRLSVRCEDHEVKVYSNEAGEIGFPDGQLWIPDDADWLDEVIDVASRGTKAYEFR
ncbi:hypothetical protein ABI59_16930 [Acidobacteria bacterium Mor1]|nr:hypothetical protein ABI59_16930 [Acidobacteria bacterium Mor1]